MKPTLLDWLCLAAETHSRPQDFTVLLSLKEGPGWGDLEKGGGSACNLYPKSGALLSGGEWVPNFQQPFRVERDLSVSDFVNGRFDLTVTPPVKQLVVKADRSETILATRVHHAAADGASAALWLSHQLGVARGSIDPLSVPGRIRNPVLRSFRRPRRVSPFAFLRPADPLHEDGTPRRRRCWKTVEVPDGELPGLGSRSRLGEFSFQRSLEGRATLGFSRADCLAVCLLEALKAWRLKRGRGYGRFGLWYPVDIRRRRWGGFGNGTSRIRLYSRFPPEADSFTRFRHLRRQIRWSMRNGEWQIPAAEWLQRVPRSVLLPLLRWLIRRPRLDYGSAVFTLLRWPTGPFEGIPSSIRKVEIIGPLHRQHALAVNCVTLAGRTWLTFTFDTHLLTAGDVDVILQAFLSRLREFRMPARGQAGPGFRLPAGESGFPRGRALELQS